METSTNPLLQRLKLPGRVFQIPSRAAFYKNGEVNHSEGEVHVHPMSALTEINLKNPDQLFNGKAFEEVCRECIPDVVKPNELFGRDVDALMFFLRLVTYGPHFEVNVKHTCENAKNHSYVVNIEKMIQEMRFLDPTTKYEVILQNDQKVTLHPVKFQHMIKLFQMNTGKTELTAEDMKANIIFNLVNLIDNVDGISDKAMIEEWAKALTTPQQNKITEVIEKMNDWGPGQTTKLVCKDCGAEMDVELPLNPISFFTE